MTSSIENLFFQWWFPDLLPIPQRALRQGSLHWLGAYVVANAKTGAVQHRPGPAARPCCSSGWPRRAIRRAPSCPSMTIEDALAQMPRVMNAIKRFALTKDSGELFLEAQRRHIAFGEVQTVAQVAENPQYEFRQLVPRRRRLRRRAPARAVRPVPRHAVAGRQQPPPAAAADRRRRARRVGPRSSAPRPTPDGRAPPRARRRRASRSTGVRIVDFTWVLAGPFANRILGDLGADVLKFQTAERATLVNSPDFPYFYVWNRSKRLVSLDMKRPEALAVIRSVIEQSDVLMENFSAGVLARWGLDYETVRAWNPEIVYVSDERTRPRGPVVERDHLRPDDPRAVRAHVPVEPARPARRRPRLLAQRPRRRADVGRGRAVGARGAAPHRRGPARRHRPDGDGHVPHRPGACSTTCATVARPIPIGNVDPFGQWCPNEVYRCGDQHEVAITCRDDDDWRRLCATVSWDDGRPRPATRRWPPWPAASPAATRSTPGCAEWCTNRTARRRRRGAAGQRRAGRHGAGRRRPDRRSAARRARLLAPHRPRRVRRAALRPLPGALERHRPRAVRAVGRATSASTTSTCTATSPASTRRTIATAWATACSREPVGRGGGVVEQPALLGRRSSRLAIFLNPFHSTGYEQPLRSTGKLLSNMHR